MILPFFLYVLIAFRVSGDSRRIIASVFSALALLARIQHRRK